MSWLEAGFDDTSSILEHDNYRHYEGRPSPPDVVRSSRFTYEKKPLETFKVDGQWVPSLNELKDIQVGGWDRRFTIAWIKVQLECYGVSFKKSATRSVLIDLLNNMTKGRQHDLVLEIGTARAALRQQYKSEMASYNHALERWKDEQFDLLNGHLVQEDALDTDRFVAKYFLNRMRGRPDRTKTKDPLVLHPYHGGVEDLRDVTDKVEGLSVYHYVANTCPMVIIGWDTEMRKTVEHEFSKLAGYQQYPDLLPTTELNFNISLFLKKRFHLNADGGSVTTLPTEKPPEPVVLLQAWIEKDSYLRACTTDFKYSHIVMGWDEKRVDAEVTRLQAENQRAKEEEAAQQLAREAEVVAEQEETWHRLCAPHREYVAGQKQRAGPLTLEGITGSYIVRWEGEGRDNSFPYDARDVLRLDIFPKKSAHGLKASFEFGIIEGIMLLAKSKDSVERLRDEQPKDDDEDEEIGEEEDGTNAGNSIQGLARTGQKRQLGSVADPWGVKAAMAKRQKREAVPKQESRSNRFYFQYVCNEAEAYPLVDDDNSHIGHLDFDASRVSGQGSLNLPEWSDEPQLFSIHKVSNRPADDKQPKREWYEYDGRRWGCW